MKIQIGEELHELTYTVNAVCDLEEVTGKQISDFLAAGGYNGVRVLFWCGLLDADPKITITQAGELMQTYIKDNSLSDLTGR